MKYVKINVRVFINACSWLPCNQPGVDLEQSKEMSVDYQNSRGVLSLILSADKIFQTTCLIPIANKPWLQKVQDETNLEFLMEEVELGDPAPAKDSA